MQEGSLIREKQSGNGWKAAGYSQNRCPQSLQGNRDETENI